MLGYYNNKVRRRNNNLSYLKMIIYKLKKENSQKQNQTKLSNRNNKYYLTYKLN